MKRSTSFALCIVAAAVLAPVVAFAQATPATPAAPANPSAHSNHAVHGAQGAHGSHGATMFAKIDTNKDGSISPAELNAHHASMKMDHSKMDHSKMKHSTKRKASDVKPAAHKH